MIDLDAGADLLRDFHKALLEFDCDEWTALRCVLIGSLVARLASVPGGAEAFRQAIQDATTMVREALGGDDA